MSSYKHLLDMLQMWLECHQQSYSYDTGLNITIKARFGLAEGVAKDRRKCNASRLLSRNPSSSSDKC